MAKVISVKSARISAKVRRCVTCGHEIGVGESYKHMSKMTGPRSSITLNFCSKHYQRPSHHASGNRADFLREMEGTEDAIDALARKSGDITVEDLIADATSILESLSESVESIGDAYRESADNIVDGFGHETFLSEELAEHADDIESFKDDLENAVGDLENLVDESDHDIEEGESCATCGDECHTLTGVASAEIVDSVVSALNDALSNAPAL